MYVTLPFLTAMGVCDEAYAKTEEVFNNVPTSLDTVIQAVYDDLTLDDDTKAAWVKWLNGLKDRPEAFRWNDNFTETSEYRISQGDGSYVYESSLELALDKQEELISSHFYSDNFRINSYNDGVITDYEESSGEYIMNDPITGLNHIVSNTDKQEKINEIYNRFKVSAKNAYSVSRKLIEHDDEMYIWEVVA